MTHASPIKPLSLRANFSWTFVGNAVYAGASWAMLIMLAKLGTPEVVGRFSLGLAVTAPIILFASLQLRAIQATDTQEEYRFRDYLGLRLLALGLAGLVILGVAGFSNYETETALVVLIIGAGKIVDAISDVIYGQLQHLERMNTISVSLIFKGLLSLILLTLGQALTGSVVWAAAGWSLASLIVLLAYDIPNGRQVIHSKNQSQPPGAVLSDRLLPRFDPVTLRRLTSLALPLGVTMMLISLNANIPRYVVEGQRGEAQLGIFSALAYLMLVGTTIIGALGQSASPRLAKHHHARNQAAFHRLFMRLLALAALLGVGGVLMALIGGQTLLGLIYQPEYATHTDVFILLMIAAGFSYGASFAGYALTAARCFTPQPVIFTVCLLVTGAACLLLVPPFGLVGAAWAAIVTNIIQFTLSILFLARKLRTSALQPVTA